MATHNLTVDEARSRADLLAVERYDIAVDLTHLDDGDEFRATSTIAFTCHHPGSASFVDCTAEVVSASLNGRPLPLDSDAGGRLVLPDLAGSNVLVVESVQTDVHQENGIQRAVDDSDGNVYLWTSFEPDDARRAWACFDQPDLKAPHRFTVTAPAAWTVVSNSAVEQVVEAGTGRRLWEFPDTPALSTYVVVVNAGPFHEVRREVDGHDLGLLCRASLREALDRDADHLFDLTAAGLRFFAERFGRPFAQQKYDQVFVPGMGGAMENWGCVTWGDMFVFPSPPTSGAENLRTEVLLHEMAHMWFGDLVTMRWWDDLWLNEAFASWASAWASAGISGTDEAWASLAADKILAYNADMSVTTHPIRQPVPDVAAAAASFDAITYQKGAAALRQLVAFVGEPAFVAGLRTYFERHAWGNTRLDDLMAAVGEAARRDLTGWTTDWFDRAGTDTLTLVADGDGWRLHAQGPDGEAPRPHRLDVAAYDTSAERWRPVGTAAIETSGPLTPVPDLPDGGFRLVNEGDLTYAAVRPDEGSRPLLTQAAGALPTSVGRVLVVSTAWDMLVKAESPSSTFVETALTLAAHETVGSVVQSALTMAASAAESWTGRTSLTAVQTTIADACLELVSRQETRREVLRTLARTATAPRHVDEVERHVSDDPELEWALLIRRSELGDHDAARVEELQQRDPDPETPLSALTARAARPDGASKEEAWEAMFRERRVHSGKVARLARAFWSPGQADVVGPYVERYLDEVAGFGGGMLSVGVIARAFFPANVGDAAFADTVETRMRAGVADGTASPRVAHLLLERADTLRRMVAARAR